MRSRLTTPQLRVLMLAAHLWNAYIPLEGIVIQGRMKRRVVNALVRKGLLVPNHAEYPTRFFLNDHGLYALSQNYQRIAGHPMSDHDWKQVYTHIHGKPAPEHYHRILSGLDGDRVFEGDAAECPICALEQQ
jgi:hypothetical protein